MRAYTFPVTSSTPTPSPMPDFSNATLTYDSDGRWVKSEIVTDLGTTTTYFVSNYYEVTSDGRVTKYYFAGAQRVAMQQYKIPETPKVTYILADHLGSTNVMVDENGDPAEMRYTAWGEVRYPVNGQNPGPSEYTYTGQYSSMDDFGLMYYNARFYSPYQNHRGL